MIQIEMFYNLLKMRIPSIKLNGEFFHGTIIEKGESIFEEFQEGYSDWNAVWFSEDENISREFSEDKNWGDENFINILYKVQINAKKIADISYELSEKISNYFDLDDFRDIIPELIKKKFQGWCVPGSIDTHKYNDYAIFDLSTIEIIGVSFKDGDNWTDYISIRDANRILNIL